MNDSNNNNNQAPTKVREENLQLFFLQGVESENRQLKVMLKKKNAELEELKMKNRKLVSSLILKCIQVSKPSFMKHTGERKHAHEKATVDQDSKRTRQSSI